jgi:hypothetical protein
MDDAGGQLTKALILAGGAGASMWRGTGILPVRPTGVPPVDGRARTARRTH